MNQVELNNFIRTYLDPYKPKFLNTIKHDPGTGKEHRALINLVCDWCIDRNLIFITRGFLKEGKIVDIIIPELSKPFIEIRSSEEKKEKEYLSKYKDLIQLIDVSNPFKLG